MTIHKQYINQPTSINFIGIVDFTKAIVRGLSLSVTGPPLSVNSGPAITLPNLIDTTADRRLWQDLKRRHVQA
jgi:hypothetical protein